MPEREAVTLDATIERKQADLPRFIVLPAKLVGPWNLSGTTTVEITLNGRACKRRSIMKWDEARWFITVTKLDCRALGIETGDRVRLKIAPAATDLPVELSDLLETDAKARAAWERFSESQRRMLRERVGDAKRLETRQRRARKALLG